MINKMTLLFYSFSVLCSFTVFINCYLLQAKSKFILGIVNFIDSYKIYQNSEDISISSKSHINIKNKNIN